MSYDLCFWRSWPDDESEPTVIYESLAEDSEPYGLVWLPVDAIKAQFLKVFPDIVVESTEMNWEGAGSYFQIHWAIGSKPGHTLGIHISCGHNLLDSPQTMRQLMSVARQLGCGVYNPQIDDWLPPRP